MNFWVLLSVAIISYLIGLLVGIQDGYKQGRKAERDLDRSRNMPAPPWVRND